MHEDLDLASQTKMLSTVVFLRLCLIVLGSLCLLTVSLQVLGTTRSVSNFRLKKIRDSNVTFHMICISAWYEHTEHLVVPDRVLFSPM